jgi:hypothetical protein
MIDTSGRPPRLVYEAGHGKRLILALTFLLLLPFFASLGPMMWQRFRHGLMQDVGGLMILAACFTLLMVLIGGQLMHSLRSRVVLTEQATKFTLPTMRRGMPTLAFMHHEIPFDQVQSVETRSEVYGGRLVSLLLTSTRVTTRAGETIVLGVVNEGNSEKAFPFPEIGAEIAARAGISVADRGVVRRSAAKRVMGLVSTADENLPLSDAEIAALRVRHKRWMKAFVVMIGLLVAGGITIDVLTAPTTTYADAFANGRPVTPGPGQPKR